MCSSIFPFKSFPYSNQSNSRFLLPKVGSSIVWTFGRTPHFLYAFHGMLSDGKNAPLATAIIPPISIDDFILSFGVEAFLKDK